MVNVVDVGVLGSDEDVTARHAQESVTIATFGKVEGRPLSIGPGLGRDSEAESRCEGTTDVDKVGPGRRRVRESEDRPRACKWTHGRRCRRR